MSEKRAIPELSIDTQVLERLLSAAAIGDVVSYSALSAAVGRDVQTEARGNLRTARQRLHRAQSMVFGVVVNVGVKRLDDAGKISAAKGHVVRGRNQFKQARATAAAIDDFAQLPNNLKVEHNIVLAQSGALLAMTSVRATKKLEGAIGDAQTKFSPSDSLASMKAIL